MRGFEPFWSFHASPHPPWQKLHSLRLSFVQIPDQGGSSRAGRTAWTSRITYPWSGSSAPGRCSGPYPTAGGTGGHSSEVQQPRSYKQLVGWWGQVVLYELSVEFSLLVELEDWGVEEDEEAEEEEEEGVKFIPDSSGGFVAVFCPLKLFLHTGQVSCWRERVIK